MAGVYPQIKEFTYGCATWSVYSPECKTLLTSHAVRRGKNLIIIDPVIPDEGGFDRLTDLGNPTMILLTSGNHVRQTNEYRSKFNIPVACPAGAVSELPEKPEVVVDIEQQIHELQPIPIYGAGPGEHAYFLPADKTLFIGDALVNLADTSFDFLPKKYATDFAAMKQSLKTLLDLDFTTLCFAHGEPIRDDAKGKLRALLGA